MICGVWIIFGLTVGVWDLTDTEWEGWAASLASMATRQISITMNIHGIRATRDAAEGGDVGNSIAGVCLWLTADGDPEGPWPPRRGSAIPQTLYVLAEQHSQCLEAGDHWIRRIWAAR